MVCVLGEGETRLEDGAKGQLAWWLQSPDFPAVACAQEAGSGQQMGVGARYRAWECMSTG
jgi:hypothetical protein